MVMVRLVSAGLRVVLGRVVHWRLFAGGDCPAEEVVHVEASQVEG
jgi:hypothetical protein